MRQRPQTRGGNCRDGSELRGALDIGAFDVHSNPIASAQPSTLLARPRRDGGGSRIDVVCQRAAWRGSFARPFRRCLVAMESYLPGGSLRGAMIALVGGGLKSNLFPEDGLADLTEKV